MHLNPIRVCFGSVFGSFLMSFSRVRHVRFPRWALRPPNSPVLLELLDPSGHFSTLGPPRCARVAPFEGFLAWALVARALAGVVVGVSS